MNRSNSSTIVYGELLKMNVNIACLDEKAEPVINNYSSHRNRIYSEFLARINQGEIISTETDDVSENLTKLHDKGLLYFEPNVKDIDVIDVNYAPSGIAGETLSGGIDLWPEYINKQLIKSIRTSSGALFDLLSEERKSTLEVFITDWSSCIGACAVVVHNMHPYIRQLKISAEYRKHKTYFTGEFLRHPLTGDLLPLWVAEWVKPQFGTGAVMVNPAHNQIDLEFARSIGLPIRFALIPSENSDLSGAWPVAPVIKTGMAVRTGLFDGKSSNEVQSETFDILCERGLAKKHIDKRLPAFVIAQLVKNDSGDWLWDPKSGSIFSKKGHGNYEDFISVSLKEEPVLAAATSIKDAKLLIMGAREQKSLGVNITALLFDLLGSINFPLVKVVESAEYNGNRKFDDVMTLAILVGEDYHTRLAIRKPLLEKVEGFIDAVKSISQTRCLKDDGELLPESVILAINNSDPVSIFRSLHKWQKTILKSDKSVNEFEYKNAISKILCPNIII